MKFKFSQLSEDKFKSTDIYLTEAFKIKDSNKVLKLTKSYLSKKIGNLSELPEEEVLKTDGTKLFGISYVLKDNSIVRMNWEPKYKTFSITSIDFFKTPSDKPDLHIDIHEFDSIVKVLPTIVEIIRKGIPGEYIAEEIETEYELSTYLKESKADELLTAYNEMLPLLWEKTNKGGFTKKEIFQEFGRAAYKLIDGMLADKKVSKKGTKYKIVGSMSDINLIDYLPANITVTTGKKEIFQPTKQMIEIEKKAAEAEANKFSFKEKMDELGEMVEAVAKKGLSNLLLISGKAGCLPGEAKLAIKYPDTLVL